MLSFELWKQECKNGKERHPTTTALYIRRGDFLEGMTAPGGSPRARAEP